MRSAFEDTRSKALKFGAHGATVKAFKPETVSRPESGRAHLATRSSGDRG